MKKIKEFFNDWKMYIIIGLITTILVVVGTLNENIENIIEIACLIVFCIFVFGFGSVVGYFVIRHKLLLRKIDSKDLDIVKKYTKKRYQELEIIESIDIENKHEFSLYDEFDVVWDMANMFGEYKRLNDSEDNVLTDDFIKYVRKLNNEDVNKILDESKKIKEIIFKYYDTNGVWKNKKWLRGYYG